MIKVPYTVTADISKYEGDAFNRQPSDFYLLQKKQELQKMDNSLGYTLIEGFNLVEELSQYCGLNKTNDIREIAMQLEEDIAILYCGKLVSMCFCFPSGFKPSDKMGMSFMEMHAPVADRQKLDRASDKVVEMISKPGAMFRRHVWTLTTSCNLSRHPEYKQFEPVANSIGDLYFRNETQTTVGYGDGRTSFFFVKVEVTPFLEISKELQDLATASINTMSEAVLQYKGLSEIKNILSKN